VRVAEMSRSLTRELGINWQSINTLGQSAAVGVSTANALAFLPSLQSSVSFLSRFSLGGRPVALDTIIDALSQDQLVRMLAEPNLTALSGEPASFLVGGEFPIPVATADNQLTVAFKQYGISLAFVPTVLSNGQINLHVRPEVSQLTTQGAVSISSGNTVIQIPAITVRRADTTVELGSGQSFAIAGLLEDDATSIANGLPFLGDIPVLGSLFRSNSFQHNQTELVIVVTPYIVKPAQSPASFILPTDNNDAPNDLERILLLRQVAHGMPPDHRPIPIDAGFLLE
jgi:pilus assembly protein CpaC